MKRYLAFTTRWCGGTLIPLCLFAALAVCSSYAFAADDFQELVNKIPRSANAVVLLNIEKAKASPMGIKQDWKNKLENAFDAGLTQVPNQSASVTTETQVQLSS